MFKFQLFEQQIKSVQEQLQAVEQALIDSSKLNLGLDDLKGGANKEVLASIGKGIYAKAKLTSEDLLVEVGKGTLVKKSIGETQELIKEQMQKLDRAKEQLEGALEEINQEMTKVFLEAQQSGAK